MRTGAAPVQLGAVANQQHAAGIVDNGAGDIHLARIIVEQRSVLVERRGADDRHIDLELPDEVDRRGADDRAVGAPHQPTGNDNFDRRMPVERHGDVEVIGDDQEILMVFQGGSDLLGGRADIDEERALVRDQGRCGNADFPFLGRGDEAPRLVGQVLDRRRDHRPAMGARKDAKIAEFVQVAADGLRCDVEARREVFDRDPTDRSGKGDNGVLPLIEWLHGPASWSNAGTSLLPSDGQEARRNFSLNFRFDRL